MFLYPLVGCPTPLKFSKVWPGFAVALLGARVTLVSVAARPFPVRTRSANTELVRTTARLTIGCTLPEGVDDGLHLRLAVHGPDETQVVRLATLPDVCVSRAPARDRAAHKAVTRLNCPACIISGLHGCVQNGA